MDYDAIAAIFLTPTGPTIAAPIVPQTAARRLRDSVEAIATIGWWSRSAADAVTALGHGFFDGYVWGRAAALGADVAPSVVVSAFGVFNANLLAPVYVHARTISSHDAILAARESGAASGLRLATGEVSVETITTCADQLLTALAALEPGPRHLFGALQALAVPTDPHGRLWRAAELVREHRGDSHLSACVAAGLDMVEMNVLTEIWLGYPVGAYSATRGFDEAQLAAAVARLAARGWMIDGALSDAGRAARNDIEAATDVGQHQLISALRDGFDEQKFDELCAQLETISAAIIANHVAPADPRKRAAG